MSLLSSVFSPFCRCRHSYFPNFSSLSFYFIIFFVTFDLSLRSSSVVVISLRVYFQFSLLSTVVHTRFSSTFLFFFYFITFFVRFYLFTDFSSVFLTVFSYPVSVFSSFCSCRHSFLSNLFFLSHFISSYFFLFHSICPFALLKLP